MHWAGGGTPNQARSGPALRALQPVEEMGNSGNCQAKCHEESPGMDQIALGAPTSWGANNCRLGVAAERTPHTTEAFTPEPATGRLGGIITTKWEVNRIRMAAITV